MVLKRITQRTWRDLEFKGEDQDDESPEENGNVEGWVLGEKPELDGSLLHQHGICDTACFRSDSMERVS